MKSVGPVTGIIIAWVCVITALPVLAAILMARHQAVRHEQAYLTDLAHDALVRAEMTGRQIAAGARRSAESREQACSDQGLDLMRRIDLSSTMLRAVGHLDGNVMTCSSFGGRRPFVLGSPDLRSSNQAPIWTNVRLLDPRASYLAIGVGSFVGIVHKEAPLSFFEQIPGLTVGVFSWSHRTPLVVRGAIPPRWIAADITGDRVFRDGDQLVAVVRAKGFDLGAVAALPASHSADFAREVALVLVPLGAAAGITLSILLLHILRTRASMPAMIRHGLKTGKFYLAYQPIVDLSTGATIGAEALIRWRGPQGPFAPPDIFIAVAERTGLISLITKRVLDLLATDAGSVLQLDAGFQFAVNFSATDMHRPNVLDELRAFMDRSGITAGNLVIEATERSVVDIDLTRETMRQLRSAGIKVAIDDFGTGYSSLGYLALLEIDFVKIDKLFVHALGTDLPTSQVAARIIEMAKDLKLRLVAEGVETRDQERLLRDMGVELAQGYLYDLPLTLDELLARLRAEQPVAADKS